MTATRGNSILTCVFLLATLPLSFSNAAAQDVFTRWDSYDFRGEHALYVGGTLNGTGNVFGFDPDHFDVGFSTSADFRLFKARVKTGQHSIAQWWVDRIQIDWNNDGPIEDDFQAGTGHNGGEAAYQFPEPANGISETHTVRVVVTFVNGSSESYVRTAYTNVTIFPAPRVFVNSAGDAFVQLRNEDCQHKKPLLVVEGIDFANQTFPGDLYALIFNLIQANVPSEYEVFILNFNDGGRDLRLNGDVVTSALQKVHDLCPDYRIALAGFSMGGVIARYSLAKLESQGTDHHVGLFISGDSPQRWAHGNRQLEDVIFDNQAQLGDFAGVLGCEAAKQLLDYNTFDRSGTERASFYNELEALNGDGYPHATYNVAMSNGVLAATWGPSYLNTPFATFKVFNNEAVAFSITVNGQERDVGCGSMSTELTPRTLFGSIFANPYVFWKTAWYEFAINYNPVFMPTWSSLGLIGYTFSTSLGDDDEAGGVTYYAGSHFDEFITQQVPRRHDAVSTETGQAVQGWLNKTWSLQIQYATPEGGTVGGVTRQGLAILSGTSFYVEPQTVTVNGQQRVYTFAAWDDGSRANPRTFEWSRNTTHIAILKAHLMTTVAASAQPGSQRRITEDTDGTSRTQHAVY